MAVKSQTVKLSLFPEPLQSRPYGNVKVCLHSGVLRAIGFLQRLGTNDKAQSPLQCFQAKSACAWAGQQQHVPSQALCTVPTTPGTSLT